VTCAVTVKNDNWFSSLVLVVSADARLTRRPALLRVAHLKIAHTSESAE